jgi:CubicO group peptidase (beta-lactamase class C family)
MAVVDGTCDPRFAGVRDGFEANFAERGEVGASVCVTLGGETVVDLWGGVADPASGRPWEKDTLALVWSCTKGAVALCAHLLADRGELDLDAPVASYWPEFAAAGKEAVTVRQLLTHQAGLAALDDPIPDGALADWELVVHRLADQAPQWVPGTTHGYHALTFGHLAGEVIRRISGRSVGGYLQDEICRPLGLDLWIGLPAEEVGRVATNLSAEPVPGVPLPRFYEAALTDPTSIAHKVMMNSGGFLFPGATNDPAVWTAEIPSANGIGNARSLAGLYRPLALDGDGLVGAAQVELMAAEASSVEEDATMLVPTRWTVGFMKAIDNRHLPPGNQDSVLIPETAFGFLGSGGSLGFADPARRLSFAYVMNRQGATTGLDERGQSLVDAAVAAA